MLNYHTMTCYQSLCRNVFVSYISEKKYNHRHEKKGNKKLEEN